MMFLLFALLCLTLAYVIFKSNVFVKTKLLFAGIPMIVGMLFLSLELYYLYLGMQISSFPNGISYNQTTYLAENDIIKAEFIAYQKSVYQYFSLFASLLPNISVILFGIVALYLLLKFLKDNKVVKEETL